MDENQRARLHLWGSRALFIGPSFALSPHRNAVDVLAAGIDAPFSARDAADGHYRPHRLLHIRANSLHHLTGMQGRMAFLYVDPLDSDRDAIAGLDEKALVPLLARLADGVLDWRTARATLSAMLARPRRPADPRIRDALDRILARPGHRPSLEEVARGAGLSASRFRHLFIEATGVPFRRYRLWAAMGAAIRAASRGETLTGAALDAGFSSSAHFSATFREMFGMAPATLIATLASPAPIPAVATAPP